MSAAVVHCRDIGGDMPCIGCWDVNKKERKQGESVKVKRVKRVVGNKISKSQKKNKGGAGPIDVTVAISYKKVRDDSNVHRVPHLITLRHAPERKRPFQKDKQEHRRQEGARRYASLFFFFIFLQLIMQS
jgi:hypothetical protein